MPATERLFDIATGSTLATMLLASFLALTTTGTLVGLLTWHWLRERLYLLFAVYFAAALASGLVVEVRDPGRPLLPSDLVELRLEALIAVFMNTVFFRFLDELLALRRTAPRMRRVFLACVGAAVLADLAVFVAPSQTTSDLAHHALVAQFLGNLAVLVQGALRVRWGAWYVAGALAFDAGVGVLLALIHGLVPRNAFTVTAPYLGVSLETLCFLIGLAFRLREEVRGRMQSARIQLLGTLAAEVLHEISNPLTVIRANSEALEAALPSAGHTGRSPEDELRPGLQAIRRNTERIVALLQRMRRLSHVGAAGAVRGLHDLAQLVDEAVELASGRLQKRAVLLDVRNKGDGLQVEVAPLEIEQVITNLLVNAADAAAARPEKWVRLEVVPHEKVVDIRVTDSGPGIPPKVRRRIMEPFFTTKATGEGTGLGLSISRRLVEEHRGELLLDDDGPNTCFVVRLPRVPGPAAGMPGHGRARTDGHVIRGKQEGIV